MTDLTEFGVHVDSQPMAGLRHPPEQIPLATIADAFLPDLGGQNHQLNVNEDLPDIEGYTWLGHDIKDEGPAEYVNYDRLTSKSYWDTDIDHEDVPSNAGIFLQGASEYVREFGLRNLSIPQYYTEFPEKDTVYRWSADGSTHLTNRYLKRCVRLANGEGFIDTDETHAVLCGPGTVVVSGPRGVFRVELPGARHARENNPLPDPPRSVYHAIGGFDIPEENPRIRTGLERFIALNGPTAYPDLDSYDGFDVGHTFTTTAGDTVSFGWNGPVILESHTKGPEDIAGTYDTYCNQKWYEVTVTPDDLPGEIGTTVEVGERNQKWRKDDCLTGTVTGYRPRWVEYEYMAPSSTGVRKLEFVMDVGLITPDLQVRKRSFTVEKIDTTDE